MWRVFGFSCLWKGARLCLGGDCSRGGVIFDSGYSSKAQCTGNPIAYLEPNRNTLQKPKRGRSLFAIFQAISMLKTKTAPLISFK